MEPEPGRSLAASDARFGTMAPRSIDSPAAEEGDALGAGKNGLDGSRTAAGFSGAGAAGADAANDVARFAAAVERERGLCAAVDIFVEVGEDALDDFAERGGGGSDGRRGAREQICKRGRAS